ncbi:hypothetical protein ACQ4PT_031948 [Festuca glaucescens]
MSLAPVTLAVLMVATAVAALKAPDTRALAIPELVLATVREVVLALALATGRAVEEEEVTSTVKGREMAMVSTTTTGITPGILMAVVVLIMVATTMATAEFTETPMLVEVSTAEAVVSPMEMVIVVNNSSTMLVRVVSMEISIQGMVMILVTIRVIAIGDGMTFGTIAELVGDMLVVAMAEAVLANDMPRCPKTKRRSDSGRIGRITVTGGTLTSDEIIGVLRGVVLDDLFPWDIQPQGDNIYKTQFPSKMELTRATRFGTFLAKENTQCFDKFTEWKSEVKPTLTLDKVWVLISGVPEGLLRDYLALWGLCGMLGKTIVVDMAYTRRHEVVRAYVRVTDISMIPFHKIIMYQGEGYELSFEIEMDEEMLQASENDVDDRGDDGDHGNDDKGTKDNQNEEENKHFVANNEKKNKDDPTSKPGVILPSAITKAVLTFPPMKFGSISNRWNDMVDVEEKQDVSHSQSMCRRLFQSPEGIGNVSRSAGLGDVVSSEGYTVSSPKVAAFSSSAESSTAAEFTGHIAPSAAFPARSDAVAEKSTVLDGADIIAKATSKEAAKLAVSGENAGHVTPIMHGSPRRSPSPSIGAPTFGSQEVLGARNETAEVNMLT